MSCPRPVRARRLSAGVFLLVALAACGGAPEDPGETQTARLKPREAARVRAEPVARREMVRTLEATTVVESEGEIRLMPRVSGTVLEVRVEEGDRVDAGAVLATLDPREAQAKVDEARIALREAEDSGLKLAILEREAQARVESTRLAMEQKTREFDRNAKAAGVISEQALDQLRLARDTARNDHESARLGLERAQADVKAARTTQEKSALALRRAELDLSYTQITAPFAGVIAQRTIKVGDSVGPAGAVFVLTDLVNLRAVIYRPQRELALFQPAAREGGAAIEIRASAEALPGAQFKGVIQLVSPSIDAQSGNFRVTVRLEPASGTDAAPQLLPGMLVKLSIVTDRHPQALVVPKRALRREGEANLLFVVRDGRAHKVEVEEGFGGDDDVEILPRAGAALDAGEQVVVVGNRELEDGAEVELEVVLPPGQPAVAPANPGSVAPSKG